MKRSIPCPWFSLGVSRLSGLGAVCTLMMFSLAGCGGGGDDPPPPDTTAPAAPMITSPATGSATNMTSVALAGTAEAGSTVEVFVDGLSDGTATTDGTGNWSYTAPGPLAEDSYNFTATATDAASNTSLVSTAVTVIVDLAKPATLAAPTDPGAYTNSTMVTFNWSVATDPVSGGVSSGVASYVLQVGTTAGGIDVLDMNVGNVITYDVDITGVTNGQVIYASVAAVDVAGNQADFSPSSDGITKDTTAPVGPSAVDDGGTITGSTAITFDWTATPASDPESGIAYYLIKIGTTAGASDLMTSTNIGNVMTYSYTGTDGQTVFANVTAVNGAGDAGTPIDSDGITINVTFPGVPGVPNDGPLDVTNTDVTFTWTAATSATSYDIQIGTAPGLSDIIAPTDTAGALTYTLTLIPANDGLTFYAQVRGTNVSGAGAWSVASDGIVIDLTDPAAPVITSPATGTAVNTDTPTLSGTAEANSTVEVFIGGVSNGTTTADGAGNWSYTTSALSEGARALTATATDAAGNPSVVSSPVVTVTVDIINPIVTVNSLITNSAMPQISGTVSESGSGVASLIVTVNAVPYTGTVIGSFWTADVTNALTTGIYDVAATATDNAGNMGSDGTTNELAVDLSDPAAPAIMSPATGTAVNTDTPTLSGTAEANSTVEVFVDAASNGTTTADGAGNWSYTTSALTESAHALTATAKDAAGNTSAASSPAVTVTVDLTDPAAPAITSPSSGTAVNTTTLALSGTAEANSTVEVFIGGVSNGTTTADGAGNWSYTTSTLAESAHDLTATATDAAGNTSAASSPAVTVTVDITNPVVTVDTLVTSSLTPQVSGTVSESGSGVASLVVTVNAVPYTGIVSGSTWTADVTSALASGTTYDVAATATDYAGNAGSDGTTNELTVDTAAGPGIPGTPTDAGAYSTSLIVTFNWTVGANAASYVLQVGTTPGAFDVLNLNVGNILTYNVTGADGQTLYARVATINAASQQGEWSGISDGIMIDVTDPDPPVITYPTEGGGSNLQPIITGTAEADAWVDIFIDGSYEDTVIADNTGAWIFPTPAPPLTASSHTVNAEASDAAGNLSGLSTLVNFTSYPAPTVVWTQPDSTSTYVPPSTTIYVAFDQAMDPTSVEAAFALKDSADQEPANGYVFLWDATFFQLAIIPDTQNPVGVSNNDVLAEGAYTIEIAASAMSADLAPMSAAFTEPFTVGDFTPPMLVSALVGAGTNLLTDAADAADVAGDDTITFVFDEAIEDISSSFVQVEIRGTGGPGGGARLNFSPGGGGDGTLSWSAGQPDQFVLTFNTDVSLSPGAEYFVRFWGVQDTSMNYIMDSGFLLQVGQSPSADITAPVVISTIPAVSETGVDSRAMVVISFSEPVLKRTLSGISITGTGITTADFSFEYGDDDGDSGPVVFFMPKKTLPAGAMITVNIPGTITDLATNALANPGSFTFTINAAAAETGQPFIDETTPPDGSIVGSNTWTIAVSFKDEFTGLPETLDVTTVDDADIRITNDDTGMILRGWRVQTDAGSTVLNANPPQGGPGLQTGWISIMDITGDGGTTVTVTTYGDHGFIASDIVTISGTTNFDAPGVTITAILATDQFTYTGAAPAVTETSGNVEYAITYTVEVGTNTLADAAGNVMTPASFTFTVAPDGINRDPVLRSIDYEVAGSTGPAGRDLSVQLELTDADAVSFGVESVTITVTGPGLTGGTAITDTIDPWMQGWWELGDGPPGGARPGMDDTNYPTSGLYTFTITLNDSSTGTSSYSKDAWVWRPADVPSVSTIDGTSVVLQTSPLLMSNPTPTFVWTNVDTANADSLVLFIVDMGALSDAPGYFSQWLLHPSTTSFTLPADNPLPTGSYLWAVVQLKLLAGEEIGSGWSLDISGGLVKSQFVYGPSNVTLSDEFGFASAEVQFDSYGSPPMFIGTLGLTGLGTFDGAVNFDYSGTYNDGTAVPALASKLYSYDTTTQDLTLSETMTFEVERGFLGRMGDLMVGVKNAQSVAGISAGARRFATTGFSNASLTGTYGFAEVETYQNTFGAAASVGEATFDGAGNVTITGTHHDGSALALPTLTYTVAADGMVSLIIDTGPPAVTAKGYIGGTAGSEILVLNVDDDADQSFFMVLTKNHDLAALPNTVADFTGQYRLTSFYVEIITGAFAGSEASQGTVTFDGSGSADVVIGSWTGTVPYTVDTANNRVILAGTLELVAGPDLDTLIGIDVGDSDWVEIIILSK